MSVKIRLARGGAKKRPYYRIVIADIRAPRDGRYIEQVGTHNPLLPKDHADRLRMDEERIKYWISKGAKPTERVARFLSTVGLWEWKHGNNPNKGKPGEKALERAEEKKGKAAARIEAEKTAKENAKTEAAAAKEAAKQAAIDAKEAAKAEAEAPAPEAPAEAAPAAEAAKTEES
ncbi:SSU ribosomal protein S16p [hydrothermal vent metagenome]|uniref:SSU ribosomal protein S16p n=1 Tax=hydrothermal vent metagenome TaxID=652676 RepID=A0A3B0RNL5_9ZZZZ